MTPVLAQQLGLGSGLMASNTLRESDFTRIAARGFGDPHNSYPHSMAWFQNHLYVGTTRNILHLVKIAPLPKSPAFYLWPVNVPPGSDVARLDQRCQIWRCKPSDGQWSKIFESPLVKSNGLQVWRDFGYRSMLVTQTEGDANPALYVSTMSSSKAPGALIMRSTDGLEFTPITERGMGNPDVSSFRALVGFNGRLFVSPSGKGRLWAFTESPVVLESSNPLSGAWRPASTPGFGDDSNQAIFEMAVFDNHLYAGTANPTGGYQIWKTRADRNPPYKWKKIVTNGAYRGKLNQAAMTMFVFGGALYVGSGIRRGGHDRELKTGPAAAELIRIHPDDSWDLIAGRQRFTPDGLKVPFSGLGPGFGNPFAGYIWSMAHFEGCLYLGTYDSSVFLSFVELEKLPPKKREQLRSIGVDRIVDRWGGFDLWSSSDGVRWTRITCNGFGNSYNYGLRTMLGTPDGLFLGVANPFAPEVATKTSAGWAYVPNPRGGLEVWKGVHRGREETTTRSSTNRSDRDLSAEINRFYNRNWPIFSEYVGYSDFANFGYWEPGIETPQQACENLMEKLLAFIPKKEGTILDVACCKGATTRHLLNYYSPEAVSGIDISGQRLETARANAPGCKFLRMSATDLEFEENSFDNIICVEAAFHFKTREKFIREAIRVLKPGGRLVLTDILLSSWAEGESPLRFEENVVKNLEDYKQLFCRAGFTSVRVIDATTQCWKGFYRHFLACVEKQFLHGRMSLAQYKQHRGSIFWGIRIVNFYVLASARKLGM
jgi:ubiquinone/menaquinone biosynthesis C-methylase UbiE